jgi:hypothetical protein
LATRSAKIVLTVPGMDVSTEKGVNRQTWYTAASARDTAARARFGVAAAPPATSSVTATTTKNLANPAAMSRSPRRVARRSDFVADMVAAAGFRAIAWIA